MEKNEQYNVRYPGHGIPPVPEIDGWYPRMGGIIYTTDDLLSAKTSAGTIGGYVERVDDGAVLRQDGTWLHRND